MILVEADVEGFGCLVKQRFRFSDGLTIIAGPNESGKTTLTECIVRLLFGYPEHQYTAALDARRPWHASAYAASLVYRLDDGKLYETRRDFSQSNVPTETFERDVMRRVPELSGTRKTSPGSELLHLSLEAYEAAAVMRAGEFAQKQDDKAYKTLAERIAELVGAAGEAGAQDATDRLDAFLKELGSERAPKRLVTLAHAKTETARTALEAYRRDADHLRANVERRAQILARRAELTAQGQQLEARMQGARFNAVRARIAAAEAASAQLEQASGGRAQVEPSPEVLAGATSIDSAIDAWTTARTVESDASSSSHTKEEQRTEVLRQLAACDAKIKESEALVKSRTDAIERLKPEAARTSISDDVLERLEGLAELADIQEHTARTAETQSAINRQRPRAGAWPGVFVFAIAFIALVIGALVHLPALILSAVAGILVAGAMFAYFFVAERGRNAANAEIEERAQQARSVANSAASNLAKECGALGLSDIRAARRAVKVQGEIERFSDALEAAQQTAAQNRELRDSLEARFNDFDRLDRQLVDARRRTEERAAELQRLLDDARVPGGDLESRIAMFRERRQGVEGALLAEKSISDARAALAGALGADTLEGLRAQAKRLAELAGPGASGSKSGTDAADVAALELQLKELNGAKPALDGELGKIDGELARFDEHYRGGGAPLEEQLAACETEEARLVLARDAAALARGVIDATKDSVHKNFAPHLNALAGPALAEITHERYTDVMIDPRDFSLRVRPADGSATVSSDALSSGTQEQLHLSLRAATAQALGAQGSSERVPLLLDDALAHADERRLGAAVRHLAAIARRQQVLLFTQRDAVLEAARRLEGVTIVHLSGPAAAPK